MGAAVLGWGEYFAKIYLLRPKIQCNSPHSRPSDCQQREGRRGFSHLGTAIFTGCSVVELRILYNSTIVNN